VFKPFGVLTTRDRGRLLEVVFSADGRSAGRAPKLALDPMEFGLPCVLTGFRYVFDDFGDDGEPVRGAESRGVHAMRYSTPKNVPYHPQDARSHGTALPPPYSIRRKVRSGSTSAVRAGGDCGIERRALPTPGLGGPRRRSAANNAYDRDGCGRHIERCGGIPTVVPSRAHMRARSTGVFRSAFFPTVATGPCGALIGSALP
jgi:hypothetical protein